jgi:aryl-alcohol dehydrogenase-like predicted oxidoreductase
MISRREYGTSGATLPVLGIGCWAFGGGDYWGAQDQRDVDAVVAAALERGVNYFDTAEGYNEGRSEEALGMALKGRREKAIIGTKVSPSNTQPSVLRQHCEDSLRRLQCEHIDLYMVHWPITDLSVEDAFDTLEALRTEGKIGAIGVSNFGVQQLGEVLGTGTSVASNQICYNLLSRAIEVELAPFCAQHQIGILAYSPLMQGLLAGKYRSADEMPPARTRTRHFRGDRIGSRHGESGAEQEMFTAVEGIREIAAELQVSMGQLSLAWILHQPAITCVLAGIRSTAQFAENLAGLELSLSPAVVQRLNQLTDPLLKKLGPSPDYYQPSQSGRTW